MFSTSESRPTQANEKEEQTQQWWNIEAIRASFFSFFFSEKSKNQDTRAIFSASHFADKFAF